MGPNFFRLVRLYRTNRDITHRSVREVLGYIGPCILAVLHAYIIRYVIKQSHRVTIMKFIRTYFNRKFVHRLILGPGRSAS